MEAAIIYVITNLANSKKYVGQTWKTLQKRWWGHCTENNCIKLVRAIKKYGKDKFTIKLVTITHAQETADYWETYFIQKYDSINNGYNIRLGGSKGKHSEETKRKMSLSQIGNTHNLGHKDSEEVRKLKSDIAKKRGFNNNRREGPLSEVTKQKLSILYKNKTWKVVDGKRIWIKE
jgi:group I intron endonuclease